MIARVLMVVACLTPVACMKSQVDPAAPSGGAPASCLTCSKGNEQGNGSDYIHVGDGSAWFVGEANVIKYCIAVSSNFGVDEATVAAAVNTAFDRWAAYIEKKHVYKSVSPKGRLATKNQRIAACDGHEDLAFYFGLQTQRTNPYLGQTTGRVATAIRTDYDLYKGWGKGFIWLTPKGTIQPDYAGPDSGFPDWTVGKNLTAIVTHELGHVFGTEHVNGTIMRKDIANIISYSQPKVLSAIDDTQELAICKDCDFNYRGPIGFALQDGRGKILLDTVPETFELLTGQKLTASSSAVTGLISGNLTSGLSLEVSDGQQTFKFPLQFDVANRSLYSDSAEVFKVVLSSKSQNTENTLTDRLPHMGYSITGTIVTKSGETVFLSLQRNMTALTPGPGGNPALDWEPVEWPFTIMYLRNGVSRPLLMIGSDELNR